MKTLQLHSTLLFAKYSLSPSPSPSSSLLFGIMSATFICSFWYFPRWKSAAKFGQKALKIHFMHKCQYIQQYSNTWSCRFENCIWCKWLNVSSAIDFHQNIQMNLFPFGTSMFNSKCAMNLFDINWWSSYRKTESAL